MKISDAAKLLHKRLTKNIYQAIADAGYSADELQDPVAIIQTALDEAVARAVPEGWQLSDEAWRFIQEKGQIEPGIENAAFEGDWGNWNWLIHEILKRSAAPKPASTGGKNE